MWWPWPQKMPGLKRGWSLDRSVTEKKDLRVDIIFHRVAGFLWLSGLKYMRIKRVYNLSCVDVDGDI